MWILLRNKAFEMLLADLLFVKRERYADVPGSSVDIYPMIGDIATIEP
jgi:hypothetical protein